MSTDIALIPMKHDTIAALLDIRSSQDETLDEVIQRLTKKASQPVHAETHPCSNRKPNSSSNTYPVTLLGETYLAASLSDLLVWVLRELADLDEAFLPQFSQEQGRTRRYVARDPKALYPYKPEISHHCRQIRPGWFVGTNNSRPAVKQILCAICRIAGITSETDLSVKWPEEKAIVPYTLDDFLVRKDAGHGTGDTRSCPIVGGNC